MIEIGSELLKKNWRDLGTEINVADQRPKTENVRKRGEKRMKENIKMIKRIREKIKSIAEVGAERKGIGVLVLGRVMSANAAGAKAKKNRNIEMNIKRNQTKEALAEKGLMRMTVNN